MPLFKKKEKEKSSSAFEKSDVAIKYSLRVSNPYGYYPEDTDRVILSLENQIELLEKENRRLTEVAEKATKDKLLADKEISRMRLQMSVAEIPDTSTEQDSVMLAKLSQITGRDVLAEYDAPPVVGAETPPTDSVIDLNDLLSGNLPVQEDPVGPDLSDTHAVNPSTGELEVLEYNSNNH